MNTGALIVQETHYDPWGVELSGLGYQYGGIKVNPYLYNGKEANGHLGVNMFDYGARMYDPAIGRWFVVDPMAAHPLQIDKSPYAYGWNNSIRYIDPDGMCPNGCNENEKKGDFYAEGAVVQNRFGASQYNDGKWKVIERTPMTENSSDGVRINGFFGGGSSSFGQQESGSQAQGGGGSDNAKLALDIGGSIYGALQTTVRPGDQWLGNNGKYYNNSWGGNQYTGSRSGAFKAASNYKWAGRATVGLSALIGATETVNGYQKDGGQFGYNAQSAAFGTVGNIAGGWAGAEAGAWSFGIAGGLIGGPPGAAIGAVIGGFVGGLGGGYLGGKVGGGAVNYYHGR